LAKQIQPQTVDNRWRLRAIIYVAFSGGASTAKEPGHFEVKTSSSQVTRPFLVDSSASKHKGRQRR